MPRGRSGSTSCSRRSRVVSRTRRSAGTGGRTCWGCCRRQERKTSWQLAEFAGDASPDGLQRLLNSSPWDEDACRDALARYVVREFGDPGAVLAPDETGFLKKGRMSAGRGQAIYRDGRAGGELPGRGVPGLLRAGRGPGADRPGAVPAGEVDRMTGSGAGPPGSATTCRSRRSRGWRRQMFARAVKAGVPFRWAAGDEVYGASPELREWLEEQKKGYVLAVACNAMIETKAGPRRRGRARRDGPGGRVAADQLRRRVERPPSLRLGADRHGPRGPAPDGPPVPAARRERRA